MFFSVSDPVIGVICPFLVQLLGDLITTRGDDNDKSRIKSSGNLENNDGGQVDRTCRVGICNNMANVRDFALQFEEAI